VRQPLLVSKKRRSGRTLKKPGSLRLLLITGIPATGKSEVGKYLNEGQGFKHLDFEHPPTLQRYLGHGMATFKSRIEEIRYGGRDTVVTWGFVADVQLLAVLQLRAGGFRWVWFDGDREVALRQYLALGRPRPLCDKQLALIERHLDPIMESLAPEVVAPFDAEGRYRPLADVARDALG
jgi:hypothetical protein